MALLLSLLYIIASAVLITLLVNASNSTDELEEKVKEMDKLKRNHTDESENTITCAMLGECKRTKSGVPPLFVISLDGFAKRYINKHSAPTIMKMGECGGHAEYMYPSFPSKTFPNHYSIATGLYPGSHGVVDNSFYIPDGTKYDKSKSKDGSFYGGEPIWNTVVKNGKVSKTLNWLGSFGAIGGVEASYHTTEYVKHNNSFFEKIDNVTDWLSSDYPPALSMLYLEEPDWTGHDHGPDSEEVKKAVTKADGFIKLILEKLHKAGILGCTNIILVSDHGMRSIRKITRLDSIDPTYDLEKLYALNHVLFYQNISTTSLQCKHGEDYRVYRSKEEVPLRYHYDHANVGFPYIQGNPGMLFMRNEAELQTELAKHKKGNHGWDNMDTQMQTIFYAVGPSIKRNVLLPPFQNVNLYNLFTDLMKIPAVPNNGTAGLLDDLLVNPPNRENPFEKFNVKRCEKISFEDCGSSKLSISPSNTNGFLMSDNTSSCSISTGKLFLLYSKSTNRTVGMEIFLKKTGNYTGEFATRLNNEVIGKNCGEKGGKSALAGLVPESSLKLTWSDFKSSSLVDKAVAKLSKIRNIRIQIGFIYGSDGSIKSVFVSGFWCEGGWRNEMDYCIDEKSIRSEAYVIPAPAVENFNCLDEDTLLLDYRSTIGDIERITSLSLLPKSMPLPMRRRVSVAISTQTFP